MWFVDLEAKLHAKSPQYTVRPKKHSPTNSYFPGTPITLVKESIISLVTATSPRLTRRFCCVREAQTIGRPSPCNPRLLTSSQYHAQQSPRTLVRHDAEAEVGASGGLSIPAATISKLQSMLSTKASTISQNSPGRRGSATALTLPHRPQSSMSTLRRIPPLRHHLAAVPDRKYTNPQRYTFRRRPASPNAPTTERQLIRSPAGRRLLRQVKLLQLRSRRWWSHGRPYLPHRSSGALTSKLSNPPAAGSALASHLPHKQECGAVAQPRSSQLRTAPGETTVAIP